jgi:hypothetical protein
VFYGHVKRMNADQKETGKKLISLGTLPALTQWYVRKYLKAQVIVPDYHQDLHPVYPLLLNMNGSRILSTKEKIMHSCQCCLL